MSDWVFDVASMIPVGQMGERLVIAKIDRITGTVSVLRTPVIDSKPAYEVVSIDQHVFMHSHHSSAFGTNEIDAFLQAAMECGWRRGLRPKNFDPSAGELAAVNRHLQDLRKIALAQNKEFPETPDISVSDIGSGDKTW